MKKVLIAAITLLAACHSATDKTPATTEDPSAVTPKPEVAEQAQPVATQTSSDAALAPIKWNGIEEMTDESFKTKILASSAITLVDFNATWCGPCKKQKPILDKLVKEYQGKINFASVDVDVCPQTAAAYSILSIPTLAFYKDAKQGSSTVGLTSYEDLKAMIDKQLK